ncbi:MAG: ABC transporter ATP-binding protein [Hyphomicrobiaceae bacterium]|nr:ABC transporter ATP-binding protein [Hyphomicrobiaceae bacterium]
MNFAVISNAIDSDRRMVSVISRLIREAGWLHAPKYIVSFFLTALVAGTTAAIALLLGKVIDRVFVEQDYGALLLLSGVVFTVFLVRGLATFGQAVLLTQIRNDILIELKLKLFAAVLAKEPQFFSGSSSEELMMIVNQGSDSATNLLNSLATAIGRDTFTLIALFSVLLYQNWPLASLLLLIVPIIAIIIQRITKRIRNISRKQMEIGTSLSNKIRGSIQGIKIVKAFLIESQLKEAMHQSALRLKKLSNKQAVVSNRLAPFMEFFGGASIAGFIAFSGWRVMEAGDTPGELVTFVFAALMVYDPARRLSQTRAGIEGQLVNVRLMYDFLDRTIKKARLDLTRKNTLSIKKGEIKFDNVSFGYLKSKLILQNVSFTLLAGKQTALVGRSGSGKSTIINLIMQFWEPLSGHILVDGQLVAETTLHSLRNQICYVDQEGFLFDGTVRDNIAVGRPDASFEEIIEAAKAADAHTFINALPNGYETYVGELGGNLSGGQRQRVSIARAILRNSPIVVLDEPTSALDAETEQTIQASLSRLMANRTTIVVAHRLSTIQNSDQILVIDDGRIVESGIHTDLLKQGGYYSRLYGRLNVEPKNLR